MRVEYHYSLMLPIHDEIVVQGALGECRRGRRCEY